MAYAELMIAEDVYKTPPSKPQSMRFELTIQYRESGHVYCLQDMNRLLKR